MFGLIGGGVLGIATFYLVNIKFDSRVWVCSLSALFVLGLCTFTGILGCIACSLVIGTLFKADL